MLNINQIDTVYLASGATDLRKSIDGLMVIIKMELKLDPYEKALFVFCNRQMNKLKNLHFKEVYYYVCSRNRNVRGKSCTYKAMLKKTEIEPLVIASIKELVSNKTFAKEVKSRIGTQIDTSTIDREIKNYESKLREVDLNKARLENEIDTLPEDTRYRERKLHA